MKRLIIVLLFFPFPVLAQLQLTDTSLWQLNASLVGRVNTGNVERTFVTPELNITHISRGKGFGFSSGNRYTYGTFGKKLTENDLLSRNFLYLNPAAKLYPYFMYWMQTHQLQGLEFRYQAGFGLTYVLVRNELHLIKVSFTGTYEQNWYTQTGLVNLEDPDVDRYNCFRATVRLNGSHLFADKIFNLYYEGYFQQAVDNDANWRVFIESGLNMKVYKGFGARIFLSYEYNNVHLVRVKPNDLILSFGVNYRLIKN